MALNRIAFLLISVGITTVVVSHIAARIVAAHVVDIGIQGSVSDDLLVLAIVGIACIATAMILFMVSAVARKV